MGEPLRVAMLGDAGIGTQHHAGTTYRPAFEAHPGFDPVATYERWDAAQATCDGIDLVCVCAPYDDRAGVISTVLADGFDVAADKPLAARAGQIGVLVEQAARSGNRLIPLHPHRYAPALRSATTAVRGGRVGLPWNVQVDFVVAGGDPSPVGELANLAIHPIDSVLSVLRLPVRTVYARGDESGAPGAMVVVQCDHDHRVMSTVTVGRSAVVPGASPGTLVRHRYRIDGSHGQLVVDALRPRVRVWNHAGRSSRWFGQTALTGLLDAVAAGAGAPTADEALAVQRVVEAAQASLRSGEPVSTEAT